MLPKNKILSFLLLGQLLASTQVYSIPGDDDGEDKIIVKKGCYVVDSGRAKKITQHLTSGRNVSISVDGDINFIKGTHIHGNSGNLTVRSTRCINADGVCFSLGGKLEFKAKNEINLGTSKVNADSIKIKSN